MSGETGLDLDGFQRWLQAVITHPLGIAAGLQSEEARTIADILDELLQARESERVGRVIDHDADGSMEQKKREGYF